MEAPPIVANRLRDRKNLVTRETKTTSGR